MIININKKMYVNLIVQENMHIQKMILKYVINNVNIIFKMDKSIVIVYVMRNISINIIQEEKDKFV